MDLMEAIRARHSVRSFTDEPISADDLRELEAAIAACNAEGGLHIRLATNEPEAFSSATAHYGKFRNVRNYLVLAGPDEPGLEERCGYYGEKIVLLAQQLGLNTCWVALTFKKRYVRKTLVPGDKLVVVVALGHGTTQGVARKSKTAADVSAVPAGADTPDWFTAGVEASLLAPTAINQQQFHFELTGDADVDGKPLVALQDKGGPNSKVDQGIVRLHFELGAQSAGGSFTWQ